MKAGLRVSLFATVVLLAGLIAGSPAWAATVKLTKQGGAKFGTTVAGYVLGNVWPNPTYPTGTSKTTIEEDVGGDSFKVDASSSTLFKVGTLVNAWCADVNYGLLDSQTYTLGDSKKLSGKFGSTRTNNLLRLANQRYATVDTTEESAAFQLAIWAILFGTPDSTGKYNLGNATYSATLASDQAAVATMAQSWLNTLSSAASTGSYKIRYFYVATQPYTQNLVAFTK
ncbi:MAG: hypothetical protein HGA75_06070 [Thiobacillus sp.]|nr:hypothetical protein [Thiobacillus sp.]